MKLYLDQSYSRLVSGTSSINTVIQPTFLFENDTVEMEWMLLTATGNASQPYTASLYASNVTMSLALGFPSPTPTASVVSQTTMSFDSSSFLWSGNLKLSGSMMENLMLGGSSSYIELQESAPNYTLTRYQGVVVVKADIHK